MMQHPSSQKRYAEQRLNLHDSSFDTPALPGMTPQSSNGAPFVREYKCYRDNNNENTCVHKETKTELINLRPPENRNTKNQQVKNTTVITVYKQKTEPSRLANRNNDDFAEDNHMSSSSSRSSRHPRFKSADRCNSDRDNIRQSSNRITGRPTRLDDFTRHNSQFSNSTNHIEHFPITQSYETTCFDGQFDYKTFSCIFMGQIPVKTQMRNLSFEERIRLARLCHDVLISRVMNDHTLMNFGDPNIKRIGECVNVSLRDKMELTTCNNILLASHRPHDVSVVTSIESKPGCIAYIGRTDFAGRIGVVLSFVNEQHKFELINFFKRNNRDQQF